MFWNQMYQPFIPKNGWTFQSSKIKRGSKGDARVLRPTLMAAVPVRPLYITNKL